MSLKIGDNFDYQGQKPNFARDAFETLVDMKSYPETSIDDGHISYCAETDKHYKFLSSNEVDEITGKWREYETGQAAYVVDWLNFSQINYETGSSASEVIGVTDYGYLLDAINDGRELWLRIQNRGVTQYVKVTQYSNNNGTVTLFAGVVIGGKPSQICVEIDSTNFTYATISTTEMATIPQGSAGQVLTKTDTGYDWMDPQGGSGTPAPTPEGPTLYIIDYLNLTSYVNQVRGQLTQAQYNEILAAMSANQRIQLKYDIDTNTSNVYDTRTILVDMTYVYMDDQAVVSGSPVEIILTGIACHPRGTSYSIVLRVNSTGNYTYYGQEIMKDLGGGSNGMVMTRTGEESPGAYEWRANPGAPYIISGWLAGGTGALTDSEYNEIMSAITDNRPIYVEFGSSAHNALVLCKVSIGDTAGTHINFILSHLGQVQQHEILIKYAGSASYTWSVYPMLINKDGDAGQVLTKLGPNGDDFGWQDLPSVAQYIMSEAEYTATAVKDPNGVYLIVS